MDGVDLEDNITHLSFNEGSLATVADGSQDLSDDDCAEYSDVVGTVQARACCPDIIELLRCLRGSV